MAARLSLGPGERCAVLFSAVETAMASSIDDRQAKFPDNIEQIGTYRNIGRRDGFRGLAGPEPAGETRPHDRRPYRPPHDPRADRKLGAVARRARLGAGPHRLA